MTKDLIKERLGEKLELPSLPAAVQRVNALIDDPTAGMREVGAAIGLDPPLTAKLLRIVNSAYYGLSVPVVSVEHAASILGIRSLRTLLLRVSVYDLFAHIHDHPEFDVRGLWKHSVLTAQLTVAVAARTRVRSEITTDELYVCGLLHDIGQFLMIEHVGDDFIQAWTTARERGVSSVSVEREVLGFSHTDLGAMLARRWSLPTHVIQAIRFHHDTRRAAPAEPLVALVAIANIIARAAAEDEGPRSACNRAGPVLLESLHMDRQGVEEMIETGRKMIPDINL
jgi:putative nucleotidyltransferase with HDIG domain